MEEMNMLTDTLLHKTNATTLSASQMVQRFSSGVTFSSRVYEDCSIYSADDREGNTRMRVEGKAVAGCIVPLPAAGTKSVRVDVVLS